jgi:hypothetical protein
MIRAMHHTTPLLPEITQADWDITLSAVCAVLVALLACIADLEAQLNQYSDHSSKPPSSVPPRLALLRA